MPKPRAYTADDLCNLPNRDILVRARLRSSVPSRDGNFMVSFPYYVGRHTGRGRLDEIQVYISPAAVQEVLPPQIKKGSKVKGNGTVEHIANGSAWVIWSNGAGTLSPLSTLTLIEE